MNLGHIVNLIATAVNTRMTMTLSQRIQQATAQTQGQSGGSGFLGRTQAGQAIQAKRLGSLYDRRMDLLTDAVEKMTTHRDAYQTQHQNLSTQIQNEKSNPTGMDPDLLQRMEIAAQTFKDELDRSNLSLVNLDREQDELVKAIAAHRAIQEKMSANDAELLGRSTSRVTQKTLKRDSLQSQFNKASERLHSEFQNPTGRTDRQLLDMARSIDQYKHELDLASASLKKATEDHDKLSKSVGQRTRLQSAADERHKPIALMQKLGVPQPVQDIVRRATTGFRRRIGSKGREFLKSALNPKLARQKRDEARVASRIAGEHHEVARRVHKTARGKYARALRQHADHSTPKTEANLSAASKGLSTAASTERVAASSANAAKGLMAMAEAADIAALSIPVVGEVLAGVGLAIAKVVVVVGMALKFVDKQMQDSEREFERIKRMRSTYNGVIANAVYRYERQSMELEMRSSMATQESSAGVVRSGMDLRESGQARGERLENIGNRITIIFNQVATKINNILEKIDFVTPAILLFLEKMDNINFITGFMKDFRKQLEDINKNTKKNEATAGMQMLGGFFQGTVDAREREAREERRKRDQDLKPVK